MPWITHTCFSCFSEWTLEAESPDRQCPECSEELPPETAEGGAEFAISDDDRQQLIQDRVASLHADLDQQDVILAIVIKVV